MALNEKRVTIKDRPVFGYTYNRISYMVTQFKKYLLMS